MSAKSVIGAGRPVSAGAVTPRAVGTTSVSVAKYTCSWCGGKPVQNQSKPAIHFLTITHLQNLAKKMKEQAISSTDLQGMRVPSGKDAPVLPGIQTQLDTLANWQPKSRKPAVVERPSSGAPSQSPYPSMFEAIKARGEYLAKHPEEDVNPYAMDAVRAHEEITRLTNAYAHRDRPGRPGLPAVLLPQSAGFGVQAPTSAGGPAHTGILRHVRRISPPGGAGPAVPSQIAGQIHRRDTSSGSSSKSRPFPRKRIMQ